MNEEKRASSKICVFSVFSPQLRDRQGLTSGFTPDLLLLARRDPRRQARRGSYRASDLAVSAESCPSRVVIWSWVACGGCSAFEVAAVVFRRSGEVRIPFSVCYQGWRSVKCTGVVAWRSARFAAEPRIGDDVLVQALLVGGMVS